MALRRPVDLLNSLLTRLWHRWHIHTLGVKLVVPNVVFALLSLLLSIMAYVGGASLIRSRLLKHQIESGVDYVVHTLNERAATVSAAAALLASDPGVLEALGKGDSAALRTLDDRATATRESFDLALVQVYEQRGERQVGLTPSDFPGEPSLPNLTEPHRPVVRSVGDRLLLLSEAPMSDSAGTVIAGIDLEPELKRLVAAGRLPVDLGLSLRGTHAATRPGLTSDSSSLSEAQPRWQRSVRLGSSSVELVVVPRTEAIERVTSGGLGLMFGTALLTTALAAAVNGVVAASVVAPVSALSAAARAAAQGKPDVELEASGRSLTVCRRDEIGLLAGSLSDLKAQVDTLGAGLERMTTAHSTELSAVVEIAQAFSSSSDLGTTLRRSAQVIRRCLGKLCPGVYHVGVFLVQHGPQAAVLKEKVVDAEKNRERERIQIPSGSKCPVCRAAVTGRPYVIQDVKTESVHLKPPLRMETYSTAAVPLLVEETVIGVLDLQCTQPGAFTPDILRLLIVLSHQIASGIHNARQHHEGLSSLKGA